MRRNLVLATFFFSGANALMYELAWARSFQLILGSTISVAVAALGCLLYVGPEYSIKQLYSGSAFGFFARQDAGVAPSRILFYEERRYGSVFVARMPGQRGMLRLLVNGRGSSSLRLHDVRASTLLGYLPVLPMPEASRAMVIGFGTGQPRTSSRITSRRRRWRSSPPS